MSETITTSYSQEALTYYRRYRKISPLPEGWSEDYLHGQEPIPAYDINQVYLQNAEYLLQVRFDIADEYKDERWVDLRILRKDRRLPTAEESVPLVQLLLGVENLLTEDYVALGGSTPNDRPILFLLGPVPEEDPDEHYALELLFTYPPEDYREAAPSILLKEIPDLLLDDDYLVVKMPAERVEEIKTWLKANDLPAPEEIETPEGETCLAHTAEVLERFDRSHPHPDTADYAEDHGSRVIGDYAVTTLLYCYPKGQHRYPTFGSLPIGTICTEGGDDLMKTVEFVPRSE
jgi:hypothetical protein